MNHSYTPNNKMTGFRMVGGVNIDEPLTPEQEQKAKEYAQEIVETRRQEQLAQKIVQANRAAFRDMRDGLNAIADWPDDLAEQVADEVKSDDEWLGTVSELTASAYGEADLGTRTIISGGDALELGSTTNPDEEMPF